MKTFPLELVQVALAEIEGNAHVRLAYSGRGMYGSDCSAILVPRLRDVAVFAFILAQLVADEEEASADDTLDMIQALQTDGLGHDTVAYFPGWQFV